MPSAKACRTAWLSLLAATLFSIESWVLGPYSWMYGYGGGLETIPTHLALLHGDRLFSSWAPFVAGGVDRFAFWGNADPFNFDTVFLGILPAWLGSGLHRLVQYFIAIYFTAKLCEEQLALPQRQALLAGLLYASFSYFTFGDMLALPALPLFLWLIKRCCDRSAWWLSLAAGLGFSTFTSFTHSVPYFVGFACLWSAVVLRDVSVRAIANLALVAVGLSIGDSPQLIAALVTASRSHREGFPPESIDWTLDGLLYRQLRYDYFNQDSLAKRIAWDLPLPLLTAGAVLAYWAKRRDEGARLSGATYLRVYAIYLLLSQRWLFVGVQNIVAEWLPWVGGIFMGRFFDVPASLLIACQLALLFGLLRQQLAGLRWGTRALTATVGLLVVFMLVRPKLFLMYRVGVDGWGEVNYQVASLARLASTETEPFRVASVLPLQPAYAYAHGIESADGWANLYPKAYREYWLRVLAPLFRNNPAAKEIFDPASGRPQDHYIFLGAGLAHPTVGVLPGEDPVRAIRDGFDVDRRFDLKLLALLNVKYLLSEFPLKGDGLALVHAPAAAPPVPYSRDWATGWLIPPSGPRGRTLLERGANAWSDVLHAAKRKSQGKDIFIYRVVAAAPRFRLAQSIHVEATGSAVLDRLSSLDDASLRSVAVLEAADAQSIVARRGLASGEVRVVAQRPDRIELEVAAAGDAFLVVANSWNRFWTATVDGRPSPLIRTNHAQYGLPLASGSHTVVLAYRPPYAFILPGRD